MSNERKFLDYQVPLPRQRFLLGIGVGYYCGSTLMAVAVLFVAEALGIHIFAGGFVLLFVVALLIIPASIHALLAYLFCRVWARRFRSNASAMASIFGGFVIGAVALSLWLLGPDASTEMLAAVGFGFLFLAPAVTALFVPKSDAHSKE